MNKVFCFRDSKVDGYGLPFVDKSEGMVERSYRELCKNQPDHALVKYHMDHDLYCTGEYCQLTGKLTAYDSPQHIVKLTQWLPDPLGIGINNPPSAPDLATLSHKEAELA